MLDTVRSLLSARALHPDSCGAGHRASQFTLENLADAIPGLAGFSQEVVAGLESGVDS